MFNENNMQLVQELTEYLTECMEDDTCVLNNSHVDFLDDLVDVIQHSALKWLPRAIEYGVPETNITVRYMTPTQHIVTTPLIYIKFLKEEEVVTLSCYPITLSTLDAGTLTLVVHGLINMGSNIINLCS